ncbi:lyase family protein [Krasilnikovia sp. MM14-A1259]|uniref:lyase family protein n=1 Tax=Krasilnikovia sp. MM14-A1259 TaxID=3373539 RepID=UPI003811F673
MTPTTELTRPAPARPDGEHLLRWYIVVEKVRLLEYQRMRQLSKDEAVHIGRLLHEAGLSPTLPGPAPDVASAVEAYVQDRLPMTPARWHVEGNGNEARACAEWLFARDRLARTGDQLVAFGRSAVALARRTAHLPMPGHVTGQPARVITPGFYFAAVADQALRSGRRLLYTYDLSNTAALGAGPMNGQELAWDRDRMARLLGCAAATPHALTAVASGSWILESSGELTTLAVAFSRFVADLITWGDAEHGYLDLPAEIAGVSLARSLPVLEQIRGRTAQLITMSSELALSQRGAPFGAVAQVPTGPSARLLELFDSFDSLIRLLTAVLDRLEFRPDRMRDACERAMVGKPALANLLTLRAGLPWREAEAVAGTFATAAAGGNVADAAAVLTRVCAERGFDVPAPESLLAEAYDVDRNLHRTLTGGSAHPDAVRALLRHQFVELGEISQAWAERARSRRAGSAETDRLLGLGHLTALADPCEIR